MTHVVSTHLAEWLDLRTTAFIPGIRPTLILHRLEWMYFDTHRVTQGAGTRTRSLFFAGRVEGVFPARYPWAVVTQIDLIGK